MATNDDKNVKKSSKVLNQAIEESKQNLSEVVKIAQEFSSQACAAFEIASSCIEKFNEKIKESAELLESLNEQSKIFEAMQANLDKVGDNAKKSSSAIDKLADAIKKQGKIQEEAAKAAGFKKGGDGKNNIYEQLNKSSKSAAAGMAIFAGAMKGLKSVFNVLKFSISGLIDVISSGVGMIVTMAQTAFNFAMSLYEGLFDRAKQMMQGTVEYMRAIEEVREKFGNVSTGIGKAVVDMGTQIMAGGAAGLSGFQLFEDRADALRKMTELAEAGGAAFELLVDQFRGKNLNDIYAFKEGLGLTNEQLAGMTQAAIVAGRPIKGMLMEVQKYARGLTNEFGGSAKAFKSISRDIIKARMDVRHFANVATKDLAAAAMYARKLGVELEKIVGVMDAFETFDSAAENVSKLSQAFGVNLDVMELMSAKTPTDQIDMIKKSFAAAGKSVESMNRQELKYLATTLNLDEATTQQLLSTKNQGASMDKLKNSTKSMEHQMLSTAESLKDVMGEIKKVVRDLADITSKGFFGTFFEGFTEGVGRSGPFRQMLMSMAQAMHHVYQAGIRLGRAFVEYFPGVHKMLTGIARIMPNIGDLFDRYGKTISDFFKNLKDGKVSITGLFDALWGDTKKFFKDAGPDGQMFAEGVGEFFSTIREIFKAALIMLLDKASTMIADGLNMLADMMEGKDQISIGGVDVSGMVDGAKEKLTPMYATIVNAFKKIKPQLVRIWDQVVKKMRDGFDQFLDYLGEKWQNFDLIGFIASNPKAAFMLALLGISKFPGATNAIVTIGSTLVRAISVAAPAISSALSTAGTSLMSTLRTGLSNAGTSLIPTLRTGLSTAGTSLISILRTGLMATGPVGLAIAAAAAVIAGAFYAGSKSMMSAAEKISEREKFKNIEKEYEERKKTDPEGAREFIRGEREKYEKALEKSRSGVGEAVRSVFAGGMESEEQQDLQARIARMGELADEALSDPLKTAGENALEKSKYQLNEYLEILKKQVLHAGKIDLAGTFGINQEGEEGLKQTQALIKDLYKTHLDNLYGETEGQREQSKRAGDQLKDLVKAFGATETQLGSAADQVIDRISGALKVADDARQLMKKEKAEGKSSEQLAAAAAAKKAEEDRKKMSEETIGEMGLTTADNVEERIKKIEEIGAKIYGTKEKFDEAMTKIRSALHEMDFNIFGSPEDRDKFANVKSTIDPVIATFSDVEKSLNGLSLDGILKSVNSLNEDVIGVVQGINEIPQNILKVQTKNIENASKTLVKSLNKLHSDVAGILAKENANVKVTLTKMTDFLGAKGSFTINTTPLNVNLRVGVVMKTDVVEKMIFSQEKSITLEGLDTVYKEAFKLSGKEGDAKKMAYDKSDNAVKFRNPDGTYAE